MVENPEGFHFDDLQLQTHADNDIEALVSLANMDGEKVEFNATGQGSVEAIFNAIDKFFNQSVRLVSYTIDAVTDGDNDIEALVSLANMDGEKVEFNATGQGSVEAIFNAIDKFFNQSVRLVSYTIDAVTDGIDTQDRVLVTVENRDTETIFNAAGLDFDVFKASAIAYINANTFVQKENAGEMGRSVSYHDMPSV
ncbi:2-isopropylmalate synthase [Streptococcus pneumoniae]|nr:2-isopropylmalate synthase [Streptococcus pneumoniae]